MPKPNEPPIAGVLPFDAAAMHESFGRIGELSKVKITKQPKTRNRFCHVFWSKPALLPFKDARWHIGNQFELTLPLAALSLACLKAMGQEAVLHTDTKGMELLGCLPYDRIYLTLDKTTVRENFWACGKIFAMQNEPLDSCQLDFDVFLYDASLVDRIAGKKVLMSHLEDATRYQNLLEFGQSFYPHLKGDATKSSNAGFLKIHDIPLRHKFWAAYFDGVKTFGSEQILKQIEQIGNGAYCIDLLIEQFNLHKICKPEYLIELPQKQEDAEGFCHLLSLEKYAKIPLVLELLKERFPEYYERVLDKWEEIGFTVTYDKADLKPPE